MLAGGGRERLRGNELSGRGNGGGGRDNPSIVRTAPAWLFLGPPCSSGAQVGRRRSLRTTDDRQSAQ